jgi:hypothetical protein
MLTVTHLRLDADIPQFLVLDPSYYVGEYVVNELLAQLCELIGLVGIESGL